MRNTTRQEARMTGERWLTVAEIAAELRVSIETVRRWLRSGRLKGVRLSDRGGYRVAVSEFRRFMEKDISE